MNRSITGEHRGEPLAVERYGRVAQALHWATAILVLTAFIYGPGGSEQRVYSAARDFDRQLHETLGLTVLTLVAVRLLWRTIDTQPDPEISPWMRTLSRATHGALYLLLFAVPLTAIAGAWLAGASAYAAREHRDTARTAARARQRRDRRSHSHVARRYRPLGRGAPCAGGTLSSVRAKGQRAGVDASAMVSTANALNAPATRLSNRCRSAA